MKKPVKEILSRIWCTGLLLVVFGQQWSIIAHNIKTSEYTKQLFLIDQFIIVLDANMRCVDYQKK